MNGQQPCRPCADWGKKDYNTVTVDTATIKKARTVDTAIIKKAYSLDKENDPSAEKAVSLIKDEVDRQEGINQWRAKQERIQHEEELRKEMERRVKEEQQRQLAEQRRRESERQRIVLEQQERDRQAKERHEQEKREAQLEQERLAKQQEQIRLQEEEEQRKIKQVEDEKKVRAFLQSNGFKNPNDLVRKKLRKVTPLHWAVGQNSIEIVRLLLAAGADPKKLNGKNETALRLAQTLDKNGSHIAIVQELTPITLC